MGKFVDLTGQRFGRLTVVERGEDYISPTNGFRYRQWFCRCDCGNEKTIKENALKTNHTKSCGCLQKEIATILGSNKKKLNKYDLSGDCGIGYTFKGEEFYFDLDDYDKIKDFSWYINDSGYVVTNNKAIYKRMHRLIMEASSEQVIDHIDHQRANNRKGNLRFCTRQENSRNSLKSSKSGVIGVKFDKSTGKWKATIQVALDTYEEAVRARLSFEKEYYKDFSPQQHLFEQYGI